ncbi:MAG: hypothetical protein QF632_06760 [Candidatus Woesearchaeota archaeon]|nr:hypothetical protein [Candidatus Woesearchaeota archaeon]
MPVDFVVLTDEPNNAVVTQIIRRLRQSPIKWDSHNIVELTKPERKVATEESTERFEEKIFRRRYLEIQHYLKLDDVLKHAKENEPWIYQALKEDKDPIEVYVSAIRKGIADQGIDFAYNYINIIKNHAEKFGFPNVIEVLFNHNVIAPELGTAEKPLPYLAGRGFKAEGVHMPIMNTESEDTGNQAIFFPMKLVENYTPEQQLAYAMVMVDHELISHGFAGIKEDHDPDIVSPEDCIMSIPTSRLDWVNLAMDNRGLKYCRDCQTQYEKSPAFSPD